LRLVTNAFFKAAWAIRLPLQVAYVTSPVSSASFARSMPAGSCRIVTVIDSTRSSRSWRLGSSSA
jgi:hypothetical protein